MCWSHLSGYLMLGQRLLEGNKTFADAWNFGPSGDDSLSVGEVLDHLKMQWDGFGFVLESNATFYHEAGLLRLDSSKARQKLGWQPVWDCRQALEQSVKWYQAFYGNGTVSTLSDLETYFHSALSKGVAWAL